MPLRGGKMKLIDQIVEVLSKTRSAMHVDDIAKEIILKYPNTQLVAPELSKKLSALLASNVKKKKGDALFSKPKNNSGGLRRGMYRLKIGRSTSLKKTFKVPEQP